MPQQPPSPIKRDILVRVRWLYVLFICMAVAIFCKILYTQYGPDGADLRRRAVEVSTRRVDIPAQRGDIVARDLRTLATTIPMFDVRIDLAAEIIDTTMKNLARAEIRAAAKKESDATENKIFKQEIAERMRLKLRDHAALSRRGGEILSLKLDTLARGLAAVFDDRPASSYRRMLGEAFKQRRRNRNLKVNPRRMDFSELKRVIALPLLNIKRVDNRGRTLILHIPVRGCSKIEETRLRTHPLGTLALRTLGVAREDSITQIIDGVARRMPAPKLGVEGAFDKYLRGEDGNTLLQIISGIATVPVQHPDNREPVDGQDVVTTLDVELQDIAERALRNQLEKECAEWGTVVLMEVATGEIHALSNLTRHPSGRIVDDMNYAIGRNMEPGSTFKLATLMTLLDDAGMALTDMVDIRGKRETIGRAIVVDDHEITEPVSLRRVFELSSNIGFSKTVHERYAADPARFVDHVCDRIGLDKPLHIQIPGSLAPVIRHPGDTYWTRNLTLEKMAYGYSFEITPMRTLCLYNAVANGGRMISPLLVKELRQYGQPTRTFQSQTIVEKVCTAPTLAAVRESLEKVVESGTGTGLRNKNYTVAAKTGTAQVAFPRKQTPGGRGGYVDVHGGRRYLATMVGYFPADKPKYSCIVVMQTYYGRGNFHNYYGAGLAGPVFKAVSDLVFATQLSWHEGLSEGREPITGPVDIKGGKAEDIRRVASRLDLPLESPRSVKGWARTVADSTGVYLQPAAPQEGKVPDVVGMTLGDAVYLLEKQGLRVAFSGRGKVASQSVPPGAAATRGRVVSLRLE